MNRLRSLNIIRAACVLSLLALALMSWSVVVPRPVPVVVAMSVGQGIGTVALLLYAWAVVRDLYRRDVKKPTGTS